MEDCRWKIADGRLQMEDCRWKIADYRMQNAILKNESMVVSYY